MSAVERLRGAARRVFAVALKELRQLARDRLTLGFIVGIPSLQLMLFGYAINLDVRHVPVAVLDRAGSSLSRQLTGELTATLRSPDHGVTAVAVEASGARALTGGWSGAVELWDLATSRATLLALVAAAYFFTRIPKAMLFWAAYILTRPLGATLGDILTKPQDEGGLDFSRITSSLVIAAGMVVLIAVTSLRRPQAAT